MKNNRGFTLIELLIVIAIISMLAAIMIPQFDSYRTRAYLQSYHELLKERKKTNLDYETWKETNFAQVLKETGSTEIWKVLKELKESVVDTVRQAQKSKQTQVTKTKDIQDKQTYTYGTGAGEKITWTNNNHGEW